MLTRFLARVRTSTALAASLIVLAALLLEIFLFNGQAFALAGQSSQPRAIPADAFALYGFTADPADPALLRADSGTGHSLEIRDLNLPVLTLYLPAAGQAEPIIHIGVDATDAAVSSYFTVVEDHVLASQDGRSRYVRLHLDGASAKIRITFSLEPGQEIRLPEIVVNQPIPLAFSWLRFSALVLIGLLILGLRRSALCREPRRPGDPAQQSLLLAAALALIILSLAVGALSAGRQVFDFSAENGDLYSRDLTDALLNGRLDLLVDPPAELASLDNPYDPYQRAVAGIKTIWDAAYYQGRYYVYYGIVPALLLFVPFHLLTGLYLSSAFAAVLFGLLGLAALLRLLDRVLCHYFPGLPLRFHLLASLALAAGSNIWWCLARPKFYEAAITAGLCFAVAGLDLLFRCWQDYGRGVLKPFRLAAGSLLLALVAGTRPNLLLLALLVLPLYGRMLVRPVLSPPCREEKPVRRLSAVWRARLRLALLIGLPWLLTGLALMAYNFLRFDSVTEFGASYQMTVTDMSHRGLSNLARIFPGLWYYLFNFPIINTVFPFIHFQENLPFGFSGYFYTDKACLGQLVTRPACWPLLAWPWLGTRRRQADRRPLRLAAALTGAALLLAAVDALAAGSTGRYQTDFAWLLVLAAVLLAAGWLKNARPDARPAILSAFGLLAGLTAAVMLLLALQGEDNVLFLGNAPLYYQLERLLAFWLP